VGLDRTAILLRVHAAQMDMVANYYTQLDAIFCLPGAGIGHDAKAIRKYRRALRSPDAQNVLAYLWKESPFVSDQALALAGLSRDYFGRDITASALASEFAESPKEVSKMYSSIRNIAISASAFNLVERNEIWSTKVILKGTKLLHTFMCNVSETNILALAGLVNLSSPEIERDATAHCNDVGGKR
jgi:hypothetical protein